MADSQVQIGRVIKPHGVRGEVVVDPTTDDPEGRFAKGATLEGRQTGKTTTLTIATVRPHQSRLLIRFEEIADRNDAERFRGMKFFADPVFDDDESYYDHELIGLHVLNCGAVDSDTANARAYEGALPEPEDIGQVVGVVRGPTQRLLEVRTEDGIAMIPFVAAIVPIVDLDNEAIVITPPDGLLEL